MHASNRRYPEENLLSHRTHTCKILPDAAKLHSNLHFTAGHEIISFNLLEGGCLFFLPPSTEIITEKLC